MECFTCQIHFIAKPKDLSSEVKGPNIFSLLNVDQQLAIPPAQIRAFSEELKKILDRDADS